MRGMGIVAFVLLLLDFLRYLEIPFDSAHGLGAF